MDKSYFIMCYSQDGTFGFPIVYDEDGREVSFYATVEEADEVAKHNYACSIWGYQIFNMNGD